MRKKGFKHSEKTKEKISKAMTGKKHWHYGKNVSEEIKRKISEGRIKRKEIIGYLNSPETRKKLSKIHKELGVGKWMLGRKHSEETKRKIRISNKGRHSGEKSNWWQGGISNSPYASDWTDTLKRAIRERDNYVCRICNTLQGNRAFDVHHIDYNKQNNDPSNLITLCRKCHIKTNSNRDYWIGLFKDLLSGD